MRRSHILALFLLTLFSAVAMPRFAVAASYIRPTQAPLNATMQRIVERVNEERRKAGVKTMVTVNATLMECAQQYSAVEASISTISHTGPDGSTPGQRLRRCGYNWRHYGENLAAGFSNPDEVMNAWMNSPSHRRNILNPKVREIGLGFTHREDDPSRFYDYFVMELGIRR